MAVTSPPRKSATPLLKERGTQGSPSPSGEGVGG